MNCLGWPVYSKPPQLLIVNTMESYFGPSAEADLALAIANLQSAVTKAAALIESLRRVITT